MRVYKTASKRQLKGNRFWPSGALARSVRPKACVAISGAVVSPRAFATTVHILPSKLARFRIVREHPLQPFEGDHPRFALEVGWVDLKLTPGLENLPGAGALLFGLRRDVRGQLGLPHGGSCQRSGRRSRGLQRSHGLQRGDATFFQPQALAFCPSGVRARFLVVSQAGSAKPHATAGASEIPESWQIQ